MCTSMAFWLPSGCVIPVEPTNVPGLMSATVDFTHATNSGLSVTVNLASAPSRFLTTKIGPSTRSIVPRMRMVSCADAGATAQIMARLAAPSARRVRVCMVSSLSTITGSRPITPIKALCSRFRCLKEWPFPSGYDFRIGSRSYGDGGKGLAPLSLCETDGGAPMTQVDDLSRSLITFEQNSTMVVVLEMSQSSWLAAGGVPGIERRPLQKLDPDPMALLRLVECW